jgi:hypothetical protein
VIPASKPAHDIRARQPGRGQRRDHHCRAHPCPGQDLGQDKHRKDPPLRLLDLPSRQLSRSGRPWLRHDNGRAQRRFLIDPDRPLAAHVRFLFAGPPRSVMSTGQLEGDRSCAIGRGCPSPAVCCLPRVSAEGHDSTASASFRWASSNGPIGRIA